VVRDRPIELVSVCDKDLKLPIKCGAWQLCRSGRGCGRLAFTPCLGWRPGTLAAQKLSARRCEWARGLLARLVRPPCLSKRSREEDESHVRSCGILFPVEKDGLGQRLERVAANAR